MQPKRSVLYTYDGAIAFPNGEHRLRNIAVGLSREGRYAGQGMRFWPVMLHTFVVTDLLSPTLKFDGLMHDTSEYVTGDTPKPVKSNETEKFEDELLNDIYRSIKITSPDEYTHSLIKVADKRALQGEVYTVGTQALQDVYERDEEAENLVYKYLELYKYEDYLDAGGKVPIEFMRRFRMYKEILLKTFPERAL